MLSVREKKDNLNDQSFLSVLYFAEIGCFFSLLLNLIKSVQLNSRALSKVSTSPGPWRKVR